MVYKHYYNFNKNDNITMGNPNILNFKSVYRNNSNSAIEKRQLYIDSGNNKRFGSKYTSNIKNNDILTNLNLEIVIKCQNKGTPTYTVDNFGNSIVKSAKISYDGLIIEEYLSQWKQIKYELNNTNITSENIISSDKGGTQTKLNFTSNSNRTYISNKDFIEGSAPLIIGGIVEPNPIDGTTTIASNEIIYKKINYNFDFWFTRELSTALPLLCLKNRLTLEFELEKLEELIGNSIETEMFQIDSITLFGDFIVLDENEYNRFKSSKHSYLIEQLKYKNNLYTTTNSINTTSLDTVSYNINSMNNYVKYICWAVQNKGQKNNNKGMGPCYFTSMTNSNLYGTDGIGGSFNIKLNGYDIVTNKSMVNFTRLNPYKLCGNVPILDRIGLYSFCNKPFDIMPSGMCNMSNIKDKRIEFQFTNNNIESIKNKVIFIFWVNYNILTIDNGYCSLTY